MDVNGPDQKRPRHHYDVPQRVSQPHPPPNHGIPPPPTQQPGGLPGPMPFAAGPSQPSQPPTPSPFHDVSHDGRNLPDPHSYVQQHPQSGHNTPRDSRFQMEAEIQRRGSAGGFPRSPTGEQYPQFPPPHRPANIVTAADPAHHNQQYAVDPSTQMTPFPHPEAHVNGNMPTHGLPIHSHDSMNASMAPGFNEGYAPSPVTAGPPGYPGMPYAPAMGPGGMRPKKGNRATQACDNCRTRKAKCDEGRPQCGFCAESDLPCRYQSIAPAKMDRTNAAIMEQLENSRKDSKSHRDAVMERLARIEKFLHLQNPDVPIDELIPDLVPVKQDSPKESAGSIVKVASTSDKIIKHDDSPSNSFHNLSDGSNNEATPSVAKQNATHIEHDTAAQKLFRWPAIKALLQNCKDLKFNEHTETYVMQLELMKGPLHLFGRGQGYDDVDTSVNGYNASSPASSANGVPLDHLSEASGPAHSNDLMWGYGISPFVGDNSKESVAGGLCSDNTLKLDSKTINNLHQSYIQNMHILHPILDETFLSKTIETFKKRYSSSTDPASSKSGFAVPVPMANVDPSSPFSKPMKRKHSDGSYWSENGSNHVPTPKVLLERSPTTALVLLMMALGKICEYREPLCGPASRREGGASSSTAAYSPATFKSDSPPAYPLRGSPSTYPAAASPGGVGRQNHLSPRSSAGDPTSKSLRNVDVIPGLAYYAEATAIIGNMMGSLELIYVQCCLLAGLFAGQLANSVESLAWIQCASRVCCVLCRDPTLPHIVPAQRNSLRMAYFTALQLESDILAEIDFDPSGISKIDGVGPPSWVPSENDASQPSRSVVMRYYNFQLHLRKILNDIQKDLYPAHGRYPNNKRLRDVYNDWVKSWRDGLQDINWNDDDPLPRDINDARLRGKYYGAVYIIHRPLIHYALELEANGELDRHMKPSAPHEPGAMGPPEAPPNDYYKEVLDPASVAIKAAIQSTTAFDGAMDRKRLIVTNILGTAHAQFGNMLVLSAVYKSKYLKHFIGDRPRVTMQHLFRRTICFLDDHSAISATLAKDSYILKLLRDVVFEGEDDYSVDSLSQPSFG